MRRLAVTLVVAMLAGANSAAAADRYAGFESWEQAVADGSAATAGSRAQPAAPSASPARPDASVAASRSIADTSEWVPVIRFGAGASYLLLVRPSDFATGERVMSEFTVSVNPFGSFVELGADLAMSRDNRFLVRPNLKVIFGGCDFSFYAEGFLALLSQPQGLSLGGGGGLGAVTGIIDNLAIEVFASLTVFDLSVEAATGLVAGGFLGDGQPAAGKVFVPAAGARLVARF